MPFFNRRRATAKASPQVKRLRGCPKGQRFQSFRRFSIEKLEDRTLPSTIIWIGGSGDWDSPGNWNSGTVPGSADDVQINTPGITVTHGSAAADEVHSLSTQAAIAIQQGSLYLPSTQASGSATFTIAAGSSVEFTGPCAFPTGTSVSGDGQVYFHEVTGTIAG
jgi:hypothetical protein